MDLLTIRKHVDSETLALPELRPFVGKTVEIRITEEKDSARDRMIDWEYHAECEADPSPEMTLADIRKALSTIPGTLSSDIRAERDERG